MEVAPGGEIDHPEGSPGGEPEHADGVGRRRAGEKAGGDPERPQMADPQQVFRMAAPHVVPAMDGVEQGGQEPEPPERHSAPSTSTVCPVT